MPLELVVLNTLRSRQNGRHLPDDIFKYIFLNENVWISLKISLKFVPRVPINNIPALVLITAWRRPGDKPLSEPMMVSILTHICVTRPHMSGISNICMLQKLAVVPIYSGFYRVFVLRALQWFVRFVRHIVLKCTWGMMYLISCCPFHAEKGCVIPVFLSCMFCLMYFTPCFTNCNRTILWNSVSCSSEYVILYKYVLMNNQISKSARVYKAQPVYFINKYRTSSMIMNCDLFNF